MKSFITAISVFAVMLAGIIIHMVYADNVTENLLKAVEDDRILTVEGVNEAEQYWNKHKIMIHLGINTTFTDRIPTEFTTLRAAIENQDSERAAESAALLHFYLAELDKINKLSLENIL